MKKDTIIFLCNKSQINRERAGYYEAFMKMGYEVVVSGDVERLMPLVDEISQTANIHGIIHVEASGLLPIDLWDIPVPNICFQIDTNSDTKRRARSAKAFDAAIVFHPGYVEKFNQLGVNQTFLLPHAIQASLFQKKERDRIYEIGWVGRFDGNNYKFRRQIVKGLNEKYKMNAVDHYYTPAEMVDIYLQSKIIVNVGKNDYLQDANLRCFEAMASGALLVTPHPTEISAIGFEEGKHFVSFSSLEDLYRKIDYYLQHETERIQISEQGRQEVFKNHAYGNRAKQLANILGQIKPDGPARQWSQSERLREIIFFKIRWGRMDEAFNYLPRISSKTRHFYQALSFITRLFAAKIKNAF